MKGSPDAMSSCFRSSRPSSSAKLCTSPLLIRPAASAGKSETLQICAYIAGMGWHLCHVMSRFKSSTSQAAACTVLGFQARSRVQGTQASSLARG